MRVSSVILVSAEGKNQLLSQQVKDEPLEAEFVQQIIHDDINQILTCDPPPPPQQCLLQETPMGKQDEASEIEGSEGPPKKKPRGPDSDNEQVVTDDTSITGKCGKKRITIDDLYSHLEAKSSTVMTRASEIQAKLDPNFPSFIKLMLPSHVVKSFYLSVPSKFGKTHLPRHDATVILEDENGEEHETKYFAGNPGLSGGWRAFALSHKLLEDDAVVFHLIQPCKFKVYIVRLNTMTGEDGDLVFPNSKETGFAEEAPKKKTIRTYKKAKQKNTQSRIEQNHPSENPSKNLSLDNDVEDVMTPPSPFDDFKNFKIVFNGENLDLSKNLRKRYYELCSLRKSYLHDHLLKSVTRHMAAGIISETVNVYRSILSCKISTSRDEFSAWDRTLEAFGLLGMEVGFLRARVAELVAVAVAAAGSERCEEARVEREKVEEEIKSYEMKVVELRERKDKLDHEIEALKVSEAVFMEVVNAPWK